MTSPRPTPTPAEPTDRPRVATYLLIPRDPAKAESLRERLAAFQRSLGLPAGAYEERREQLRARPTRRRLVQRRALGGFDLVCVVALHHLAPTRARVAQLVLRLDCQVITLSDLRLDPKDRVVRWLARERSEHQRRIHRGLKNKRPREADPNVERVIAIACELSATGLSMRQIAERLTEAGHRTRRGREITHKQVSRWLRWVRREVGRDQVICPTPSE